MSEPSILDDFLAKPQVYNATSLAKFIMGTVKRCAHLTGGEISVSISSIDESKSIKNVLEWCNENPQPADKIEKAIDVMVSGWERAKFIDLLDNTVKLEPK